MVQKEKVAQLLKRWSPEVRPPAPQELSLQEDSTPERLSVRPGVVLSCAATTPVSLCKWVPAFCKSQVSDLNLFIFPLAEKSFTDPCV